MEYVKFHESDRQPGAMVADYQGTIAFPDKKGPQPKEGEIWEVLAATLNARGTVYFLRLGKKYECTVGEAVFREFHLEKRGGGKYGQGGINGCLIDGDPSCFRQYRSSTGRYHFYTLSLPMETPPSANNLLCVMRVSYKIFPENLAAVSSFEILSADTSYAMRYENMIDQIKEGIESGVKPSSSSSLDDFYGDAWQNQE